MSMIQTVLAFLLALGPLIIFHELGHYSVARLCGVKVLRFSLGMGKVVWSRRFGADQTEWAISMFPLGGYVKMLDNRDPDTAAKTEADAKREFTTQSVWRRMAIIAAGPAANFILAISVFTGLYMHGLEEASTRVGQMPESSASFKAGLREGDRVTGVNGVAVAGWSDLRFEVMRAALDKAELRLDVAQAGGGRFSAAIPAAAFGATAMDKDILAALGLLPQLSTLVGEVLDGGAAQRAGMLKGDRITAIDGQAIHDSNDVIKMVGASAGHTMSFSVLRGGQALTLQVRPEIDGATKQPKIKAQLYARAELVTVAAGPVKALGKAVGTTWNNSVMQVKLIGQMIVGKLSWKNVTGPITIADYAGQTARAGPIVFLHFIAMISISLGVMNLLPIPVLDGGLLLYYSLEVLTGRPLPERIGEYAQRLGVGLLVMLMALAVFNDVARLL